jgi:hypothetical protein
MTACPSSSVSGSSSSRAYTQLSRSGSTSGTSRTSRSSRASPHLRSLSSTTSEQAYRTRREADLEVDHLAFDTPLSSCDSGRPTPTLSPSRPECYGHPSRRKVRSISAIPPGAQSSSCHEAPARPCVTTSLKQQAALARCPQAHQQLHNLPFTARDPVPPRKEIQVPLASPVSSVFPLPPSSPRLPQHPRIPECRTPVPLTPQTSLSSFSSTGSTQPEHSPSTGFSVYSASPHSHRSKSNRYVVIRIFLVYFLHPLARSVIYLFE